MSDTPRDCKHGHLARSCEICDLERALAEKERELAEAERLISHAVELMTLEQVSEWSGVRAWQERDTP